tara:strand:+ start:940 stop:1272 length:333 start_codon:yes stop_codon:yes gene_type:complete
MAKENNTNDFYRKEELKNDKYSDEKKVIAKKLRKEFGIKKPIAFINEIIECEYYINVIEPDLKSNPNRYGNNFMLESIFTMYVIATYSYPDDYVDPIRLKEFRINIEDYK